MRILANPLGSLVKWILITIIMIVLVVLIIPALAPIVFSENNFFYILFGIFVLGFLIALPIGGVMRIIQYVKEMKK